MHKPVSPLTSCPSDGAGQRQRKRMFLLRICCRWSATRM